ncbi:MAG: FAD binding domain-containing protein, partial [Alphaproteobacteria bacterium]|nr:FAD binding domain-containing protein [Alphaproteobacteria bacterium]
MDEMRYEAPETLDAAVALLAGADGDARILAGGTDVLVLLHCDMIEPGLLVDIKKIPELTSIAVEAGGFRVGAAVSAMELVEHDAFSKAWPGVIEGVKLIGSIQIMGRATMGGNLCNASPAADSVPALIAAG